MRIQRGELVLFQGDSITNAWRRPEEINNAAQLGAGYALMIAARLWTERPADDLRFENRGVSGEGIAELLARWDEDCLQLRPDVVSILIGVNDTIRRFTGRSNLSTNEFERTYRLLLERTRDALPQVRFVMCEPFALPCGMANDEWRRDIADQQEIVRKLAREFDAVFVPFQASFDEAAQRAPPEFWSYDGVHATAPGFELMARSWLQAVNP